MGVVYIEYDYFFLCYVCKKLDTMKTTKMLKFYPTYAVEYTHFAPETQQEIHNWAENLENRQNNLRGVHEQRYDLSQATRRKVSRSIDLMRFMCNYKHKNKAYRIGQSKKFSFITLTLPTEQMKQTAELNKGALNDFLNVLRNCYNLKTYLWRLELQKNGNAHWHIVSDISMNPYKIREVWNNILDKYGMLDAYRTKFKNMPFSQYLQLRKKNKNTKVEYVQRAYLYGKSTGWSNPNTTDFVRIKKARMLTAYLCKYIAKGGSAYKNAVEISKRRDKKLFRLWGRSQNLAKAKNVMIAVDSLKACTYFDQLQRNAKVMQIEEYATIYSGFDPADDFFKEYWQHLYEIHYENKFFAAVPKLE